MLPFEIPELLMPGQTRYLHFYEPRFVKLFKQYIAEGRDTSSLSFSLIKAQLEVYAAKSTHGMRWEKNPEILHFWYALASTDRKCRTSGPFSHRKLRAPS